MSADQTLPPQKPPNFISDNGQSEDQPEKMSSAFSGVPDFVTENVSQLIERQKVREKNRNLHVRIAHHVTDLFGSPAFLLSHLVLFAAWIVMNVNLIPGLAAFDPYPFGSLTVAVSLEAIVLSVMVLMVQNQIHHDADRRAELDLHVNLLTEREVTLILQKLIRIEKKLGVETSLSEKATASELMREINPVELEKTIEASRPQDIRMGLTEPSEP